jgi:hypothetical protein
MQSCRARGEILEFEQEEEVGGFGVLKWRWRCRDGSREFRTGLAMEGPGAKEETDWSYREVLGESLGLGVIEHEIAIYEVMRDLFYRKKL